jgi:hypothetical protein
VLVALGDEPGRAREQAAEKQSQRGESEGDSMAEWQRPTQAGNLAGNGPRAENLNTARYNM